jgi:prepilin-type N-terminal cleavage/methylation domain-containing protein
VSARRAQRGFTLIEMMIALLVSTLLVGMILSIFARVSLNYRGQQQVAHVQQILSSAAATIGVDAKQAGLGISQGYKLAIDGGGTSLLMHSPIQVTDSATGPDTLTLAYADPSSQAAVTATAWPTSITVDSAVGFASGDVVVLSTPNYSTQSPIAPGSDANIATFDACVLQISGISGNVVTFSQASPWGRTGNDHCNNPGTYIPSLNTSGTGTMMYKFVAHAYRVSAPVSPNDGTLDMSPTGNLVGANDWTPLGYGFTDLQIATELYDNDGVDQDNNGDAARDFYSGSNQQTDTAPISKASPSAFIPPIQLSISIVARTDHDVEGITTGATPALTSTTAALTSYNSIGDRGSVTLPVTTTSSACDATCVTSLQGNRIYRYTTFTVDLRNMGVGR